MTRNTTEIDVQKASQGLWEWCPGQLWLAFLMEGSMIHKALENIKFMRLSRRLQKPRYQVVGLLESVWLLAQTNAKDGDLSALSVEDIGAWIGWDGDDQEMIDALVDCCWLDRDGDSLKIHDWAEHCPKYLKGGLATAAKHGADSPGLKPIAKPIASSPPATSPGVLNPTLPNHNPTLPNPDQTKTKKKSAAPRLVFPPGLDDPTFKAAWGRWVAHRKEIKKPLTKTQVLAQFTKLESMGLRHAIECIDHTIAMGWQGLRPPDSNGKDDGTHNAEAYRADLDRRIRATKQRCATDMSAKE